MGCGSCTAECPAKAITLRHYVDAQVLAAMDALLGTAPEPAAKSETQQSESTYLEQVGVARLRHKAATGGRAD